MRHPLASAHRPARRTSLAQDRLGGPDPRTADLPAPTGRGTREPSSLLGRGRGLPRGARTASLIGALGLALIGAPAAVGAPVQSDDAGTWSDDYRDNLGVDLSASTNVVHDPFGRFMTVQSPPSEPGEASTFLTSSVAPASFSSWRNLYLAYSAASPDAVIVELRGASGAVYGPWVIGQDDPGGAVGPSDDPAFDRMIRLDHLPGGVPASEPSFQVAITLVPTSVGGDVIAPTVQSLRVTWSPESQLLVDYSAASSVCSRAENTYRVRVSVSLVEARDLVVWAPLPAASANPFGQDNSIIFTGAKDGGQLHPVGAAPLDLGHVTVPPGSVYWQLGTRSAGSTFILTYTARSPQGTLAGTTYTGAAAASASNSPRADTGPVTTTVNASSSPFMKKSTSGTFQIFGAQHALAGNTIAYNLDVGNFDFGTSTTTCAQTYFRAIVYDDVSAWLNAPGPTYFKVPPGIHDISHGGQLHVGPGPLCVGGTVSGEDCLGGKWIPAGSVWWDLGHLSVSQRLRLTYRLTIEDEGVVTHGQQLSGVARIESLHEGNARTAGHTVTVGINNSPDGGYGTGEQFGFAWSVTGNANDFANRFINYGDPMTYLFLSRNRGASVLLGNWQIAKVPAGATFTSAWMPSGSGHVIYYNTGGADLPNDTPPDFDVGAGTPGASWTTSVPSPASGVKWVAYRIPRLASEYFPEDGVPNMVISSMTVRVDVPEDACPSRTLVVRGNFYRYGVELVGGGLGDFPTGLIFSDIEPTEVIPLVPHLGGLRVASQPQVALGAGEVNYHVTIPNRQPGGAATDTALNVTARLNLPSALVNGVLQFLPLIGVDAPGGTVDYSELPARVIVHYPAIFPNQTQHINVRIQAPPGLRDGSSFSLSATAIGHDDVCGPVSGGWSASTIIRVDPSLSLTKRVNLAVASQGQIITYGLDYMNVGDGVATRTWVVDRVPTGTTFVSADRPPAGGSVWFSQAQPPSLPATLREGFLFSDSLIRSSGLFAEGIDAGDGTITSPWGAATTYIALSLDDPAINPPQLVTHSLGSLAFRVRVADGAPSGTVVLNEAAVLSQELIQAVSNQTQTVISGNPSLDVARLCPDVVTSDSVTSYEVDYFNNSSNLNEVVVLEEFLPEGATFVSAVHTWNAATGGAYESIDVPAQVDGQRVRFDVTAALGGPLQSLEGGRLTIQIAIGAAVPSNTTLLLGGLATADNAAVPSPVTIFTECAVLVANADLWVRKLVSRQDPIGGEELTYTVIVSNQGPHFAEDVVIRDTLPAGLTYVPGTARVTTAGWSLQSNEPVMLGGDLVWSVATNNGIVGPSGVPGYLPGRSQDVTLTLRAQVASGVAPATALQNCANVATATNEDANFANQACVTSRVPLPDVYIQKLAPELALPGDRIVYRLIYGNLSRQPAGDVVIIDSLWDSDMPAPDGEVDVTLVSATALRGEALWYASASLLASPPSFNPADPGATGWASSPAALTGPVTHVAIEPTQPLGGLAGPYDVYIEVILARPDGLEPQPGSTILNTATISMIGPDASDDDDPSNNTAVATTQTPGIDLVAGKVCDPEGAFPGVRPGEQMTFSVTLRNAGTVTAYGLRLAEELAATFEFVDDDAVVVAPTDAGGVATRLVDMLGQPLVGDVPWTRDGDTYVVGSLDPSSAVYYRRVGLLAGHQVSVTILARVALDVPSGTELVNTTTVSTDYREDWQPGDPAEENLDNNVAACFTVAYRPDPLVQKDAADEDGGPGPVGRGDRIHYTITYDNIGAAEADGVVIEDLLPSGTAFVVGSIAGVPDEASLELDDGSGAWTYQPVGATGEVDPAVVGVRVVWGESPMRAPSNATFSQSGATQFADGTFIGTAPVGEGVTVGSGSPSYYLSPVIPGADEGRVLEWGRVVVDVAVPEGAEGGVLVTVLDPTSGEAIPGYIGLEPDISGAIDLSSLDAGDHPSIQLRAEFVGGGITCDGTGEGGDGVVSLESATPYAQRGRPFFSNAQGQIAGKIGNGVNSFAVVWTPDGAGGYRYDVLDDFGPMGGRGQAFDALGNYYFHVTWSFDYEVNDTMKEGTVYRVGGDGTVGAVLLDDNTTREHAPLSAKWKRAYEGVGGGEWRARLGRDDGPPQPLLGSLDAEGEWVEVTLEVPQPFDYASVVQVLPDGSVVGECESSSASGKWICVWTPQAGGGYVGRAVPSVENPSTANGSSFHWSLSNSSFVGRSRVGSFDLVTVWWRDGAGDWQSAPVVGPDGVDLIFLNQRSSILGHDHFLVRDRASTTNVFVLRPGGEAPHGLHAVPIPSFQSHRIFAASADGTLVGDVSQQAIIWPAAAQGGYDLADRLFVGEGHGAGEVVAVNSWGLAFGWLLGPRDTCSDDTELGCVRRAERCSCTSDFHCQVNSNAGSRCISGQCHDMQGYAWVPTQTEEAWRRVRLEGARRADDSDGGYQWEAYNQDTDYPPIVTEAGIVVGTHDRPYFATVCEDHNDDSANTVITYWDPAMSGDMAERYWMPMPTVHVAKVIGGNAEGALVGSSYDDRHAGHATLWSPTPDGWDGQVLPPPSIEEVVAAGFVKSEDEAALFRDQAAWSIGAGDLIGGHVELVMGTSFWDRRKPPVVWVPGEDGYQAVILPNALSLGDVTVTHLPATGLVTGIDVHDWGRDDEPFEVHWARDAFGDFHFVETSDPAPGDVSVRNDNLRMTAAGLLVGFGHYESGGSVAAVVVGDPAAALGFRAVGLTDGSVNASVVDMNAAGVAVGQVGDQVTAWVPDGVGGWTQHTVGPGSGVMFISSSGAILGRNDGGQIVVWEQVGPTSWVEVALPGAGDSVRRAREAFEQGHVLEALSSPRAWYRDGGSWVAAAMTAGEGASFYRLADVVATSSGHAYVGLLGSMSAPRLVVWSQDGEGGWAPVDLTPEGYTRSAINMAMPYRQVGPSTISGYAGDYAYDNYGNLVGHNDSLKWAERFIWVEDATAATGWTAVALPRFVHRGQSDFAPLPQVPGLWLRRGEGRDHRAELFGCQSSPSAVLEGWRAIYRTDQSPSFTMQLEVGDLCQTEITNTVTVSTDTPEITTANNTASASIGVRTTDVGVTVDADRGTAALGETITYTFTVTNHGAFPARDVVLEATYAPGVMLTNRTWQVGTLGAGESRVFTDAGVVTEAATGVPLVVNAAVTTSTIDCNSANDLASDTTITGNFPNVFVQVTAPASAPAGEPVGITITYGNDGNVLAEGVEVAVSVPAGLALSPGDQALVLTPPGGQLAPGQVVTVVVTVVPDCAFSGTSAAVAATIRADVDVNASDNTSQAAVIIAPALGQASLLVVPDRATAEPGDAITWTLHYRNTGAATARSLILEATLPAGAELVTGSLAAGGERVGDQVRWQLPELLPGQHGAVAFTTVVTGAIGATLAASAQLVGAGTCDVSAAAEAAITGPGLHVVKTASAPAVCGETSPVTWRVTVTNTAATPVAGVVVTDAIPTGARYVPGSISGPGALDAGAPTLVWNLGALAAGAGVTLGYATTPPAGSGTTLTNVAQVEVGGEIVAATAPARVRVDCTGGLTLTKGWGAGCAQPGDTFDVHLVAANSGSVSLSGVVVSDWVPPEMAFNSASDGGTYSLASGRVHFEVPTLGPGQRAELTYRVTLGDAPRSGALLLDQASASAASGVAVVSNGVAGVVLRCGDGNPCTADLCSPGAGCLNPALVDGTVCDDGDLCTLTDVCVAGLCQGTDPVVCEALDQCHAPGVCAPETGLCTEPALADGTPCDDGDACTMEDICVAGTCEGGPLVNCDDGDACTVGTCDPVAGCVTAHAPEGTVCDDGNPCSSASACTAGECRGVIYITCDDGDPCTADFCDPAIGCTSVPAVDGLPCFDGDLCTTDDVCVAGACVGTPRMCPDAGECFEPGVCDPLTGACAYVALPGDVPVPIGIEDLGTLGGPSSGATALDAEARVVGWSTTEAGVRHAFLWEGGAMSDLTPDALDAVALAIGEGGHVAGALEGPDGRRAFLWHDGALTPLWAIEGDLMAQGQILGPTASGRVAGNSFDPAADPSETAFAFAPGGAVQPIAVPSGTSAPRVAALNDAGVVVGRVISVDGDPVAFRWSAAGGAVALGEPGVPSEARAVNALGETVGDHDGEATLWRADGARVGLGLLCTPGPDPECGGFSVALFITDDGVVLGRAETPDGHTHAFLWTEDVGMLDLTDLGGGTSEPMALSVAGSAVGTSLTAWGATHAVLWDLDGQAFDLGTAGADASIPVAVNAHGDVAGNLTTAGGGMRAFFWSESRGLQGLGTFGGASSRATDLNDSGRVVGAAQASGGSYRAFISDTPTTACVVCEEDLEPPVLICPVVKGLIECVAGGAEVVLTAPSAYDACGGPVTITSDAPERFELGTTPVTYTATDEAGNVSSCVVQVVVADTRAPEIHCPDDLSVEAAEGICGALIALEPSASDACDPADELVILGPAPDAFYPVGITPVTFVALDRAGNQATCRTTVTVIDPEPFRIACEPDLVVDAPADRCAYPDRISAEVQSACAGDLVVYSESDGFPVGESFVTFSATSPTGALATCTSRLEVRDVTPPTVSCGLPAEIDPSLLPLAIRATASDACGATLALSAIVCRDAAGAVTPCGVSSQGATLVVDDLPPGEVSVSWTVTATDPSGNSASEDCEVSLDVPVGPIDELPIDTDGMIASGGGGCAGAPLAPAALVLLVLGWLAIRRRRGVRG